MNRAQRRAARARVAAALRRPPGLHAFGVEVPARLRPHLEAALEALTKFTADEIVDVEIIGVAGQGKTLLAFVPRADLGRALADLDLRPEPLALIKAELAEPVPRGRARITLLGERGELHFAGARLATLSPGGAS